jgi:hypothetical protein
MTVDPLRGDALQPGWLMFMTSTPAARVWSGAANFKMGPSGPDTAGGIYQGLGLLVNVPSLKLPMNGAYAQHVFEISGVTSAVLAVFDVNRASIQGARLSWGRVELDASGQPVAAPLWLWTGFVDGPRLTRNGDAKPPTRTLGLVCSSGAIRRNRRQFGYWTGVQQRLIDPTDSACDLTNQYAGGTSPIWPN